MDDVRYLRAIIIIINVSEFVSYAIVLRTHTHTNYDE